MKDVLIHLTTTIEQEGQREQFAAHYHGRYAVKNEQHYFLYQDEHGQSTALKYNHAADCVTIQRSGHALAQLVFDTERDTESWYRTAEGAVALTVRTDTIQQTATSLSIHYALLQQDQLIGTYHAHYRWANA